MLNDFIILVFYIVASVNILITYSCIYWGPSRIEMVDLSLLVSPLWQRFHIFEIHLFIQQILIHWLLCAKHCAGWIHAGKMIQCKCSRCFLILGNLESSLCPQNVAEMRFKLDNFIINGLKSDGGDEFLLEALRENPFLSFSNF